MNPNDEMSVEEIQIRIDEASLFLKEALDIYHGIPIDTEAWWYKYHMQRMSDLVSERNQRLSGGKES